MEHWTRGQILGQGSQATVSIATVQQSGLAFAVKSAELSQSELLQKEQRILSTLSCPQIIAYEGYDVTREDGKLLFNIFLEYAPGGTLIDTIRKHGGFLDEGMIRSYARDILLGLHHLHSNGIVHCDIKGHNILVTSDGAKIADLGCARKVTQVSKTPIAGTPVYMAPEVARGEHQGFPADVWALGCTIIEMATGRPPWTTISDPVSALYQIGYSGMVPEIPSFMSKQAIDFVSKCLKRDPVERWSASELLRHAFVTEEACSVLKGNTSSNVETPTSVLDQGLWESREELEATWKSTHKNCSRSPTERIRQLAQGTARVPNWAWDDSWVTVRSKDSSSFEDFALVYANEATENSGTGIVWFSGEYSLINISCNEPTDIGGLRTLLYTSNSSSCSDISVMPCRCVQDDLCGGSNFDKKIIVLRCIIHLFLTTILHEHVLMAKRKAAFDFIARFLQIFSVSKEARYLEVRTHEAISTSYMYRNHV